MEDKLKVGMYAYSKESREKGVGKIIEIDDRRSHLEVSIKTKKGLLRTRRDYVKASYDITDLIEVGDYVNDKKVSSIGRDAIYFGNNYDYLAKHDNTGIKTILTKEQFEQNSYRIGE